MLKPLATSARYPLILDSNILAKAMVQTILAALVGATLTAISVNAQTPTVVHDLFLPWADEDSAPTAASVVDAVSLEPLIAFHPSHNSIGCQAGKLTWL